jgi:formylglycine-generating enzyme required for sulfatase activity
MWASEWGQDRVGVFVAFPIANVTQYLRWISPGSFWMGSPETEAERNSDEGPRHEVTILHGFWLFDTACTQALWEAVMGDNPSYFKGPDRPVENVSWEDVQKFLAKINEMIPELELVLLSEAQWEYACRAGTETPFSFGETITPEQVNYNSGETVPVASLPANPWGLYEMHGNVWEWCADGQRSYTADPVTDPMGPTEAGAGRVLRGGSWYSLAQFARSASRFALVPGYRYGDLGFRCARVQES